MSISWTLCLLACIGFGALGSPEPLQGIMSEFCDKGFTYDHILRNLAHDKAITHDPFDCGDIFRGFVMEAHDQSIDTLSRAFGVATVWPVTTFPVPVTGFQTDLMPSNQSLTNSVHRWTAVDKVHKAGIKGKGTKVAIIDTGVDYTHTALGGCFGPGCKIAGGYDLVGPEWNAHSERRHPKRPDLDPMDPSGHGTHVAGIIAGQNQWFTGVAPAAEIFIYKVFSDDLDASDTTEDVLIQAFCDAYSSGADIITASINRPGGFIDSPWALVASRIVDRGVFVSIAAGNDGERGPLYSGMGSNGHNVVSVAAINVSSDSNILVSNPQAVPMAAYFTSWGPTSELIMKPDIGGPGYNITSTYLGETFKTDSGSSMAAPYIAGVAALYISHHGGRELHGPDFAKHLARRIISSGRSVAWSASGSLLNVTAPPSQVGTGLVDAEKVLFYTTKIDFEPFSLLDTENFQADWEAQITNNANLTVEYQFAYESQAGVEMYDGVSAIKLLPKIGPSIIDPRVSLPPRTRVRPGETRSVRFKFQLPAANEDMLPLYGGKIWIIGNNTETLCIPYGGVAYDTEKAFDTMFDGEPSISGWENGASWSFDVAHKPLDYADLSVRLAYACVHLRWDIFEENWTELYWDYPLQIGENGYVGSATTVVDSDQFLYLDPSVVDINKTISFPLVRVPRGHQRFWWLGKMANGTQIAPGNYTMRFAALRPYGDPRLSDHWDVMDLDDNVVEILPQNRSNTTFSQPVWQKAILDAPE